MVPGVIAQDYLRIVHEYGYIFKQNFHRFPQELRTRQKQLVSISFSTKK